MNNITSRQKYTVILLAFVFTWICGAGMLENSVIFAYETPTDRPCLIRSILLLGASPEGGDLHMSCLAWCVYYNHVNEANVFLEFGADPNTKFTLNDDCNVLIEEVMNEQYDMVKLLMEFGANPYYRWKGKNAFDIAIENKEYIMLHILQTNNGIRRYAYFYPRLLINLIYTFVITLMCYAMYVKYIHVMLKRYKLSIKLIFACIGSYIIFGSGIVVMLFSILLFVHFSFDDITSSILYPILFFVFLIIQSVVCNFFAFSIIEFLHMRKQRKNSRFHP